jgi:hypothetical protein
MSHHAESTAGMLGMSPGSARAYGAALQASRRGYERARLQRGGVRAAVLTLALAAIAVAAIGVKALAWVPVFLAVWTLLEWRGGPLLRGGRVGAVCGALVALVPTSLFMTCCRIGCSMGGGACCSTSLACAGIGTLVGLGAAARLSRLPAAERSQATMGAGLGIVATAIPRCAGLMVGEGAGLLLGLLAGTLAAGLASAVVGRLRQPA